MEDIKKVYSLFVDLKRSTQYLKDSTDSYLIYEVDYQADVHMKDIA